MLTESEGVDDVSELRRSSRGPSRLQLVVLVLALCFLAGVIGWWIGQPGRQTFNRADVGFLSDMEAHHSGAISMSFDYLGRQNDSLVGHFAREIILTQTQEIGAMNALLNKADDRSAANDDVAMDWMGMPVRPAEMPGMATDQEIEQLRSARGVDADDQFTRLMIHHHAAGIAMADYVAAHGENEAVKRLATAMARVQRSEIAEMNNRRSVLGLPVVPQREIRQLEAGSSH